MMACGTLMLIVSEYTPVIRWLAIPWEYLLSALNCDAQIVRAEVVHNMQGFGYDHAEGNGNDRKAGRDRSRFAPGIIAGLILHFCDSLAVWHLMSFYLFSLLMDFGSMDFIGTLIQRIMRPLFTLPGCAAIDCMASWVGNGDGKSQHGFGL